MTRFLLDASPLIALAQVGALELLRDVPADLATTARVRTEATPDGHPGSQRIEAAFEDGWIQELPDPADPPDAAFGLDPGELSLLEVAGPSDVLVLDDRNARSLARARGLAFTGTLGFLVAAAEEGHVPRARARATVDALAGSSFRLTSELYRWATDRLERA